DENAPLGLAAGVTARETVGLDAPGFKASIPFPPFDAEVDDEERAAVARYWTDPIGNGDAVVSPVAAPAPALRFGFADRPDAPEVRGLAREGAVELLDILRSRSASWQLLEGKLTAAQLQLLKRLMRAGMVTADALPADGDGPRR
ncbi:MAG: NAD(P)/FAD-dependent oxidoreductase, partial [Saccharothrix sp.]|nr:NAD(P)/FAD-dependent oxidoreductase [Saccharothrix sp.]